MARDTFDCTRVATILMALQDGKLAENDGHSLDSLLKSGYKPLDNDEEEDSSDDDDEEEKKLVILHRLFFVKFKSISFRVFFG